MQSDDRRRVTALFADVSGFTALADRLEPDELHEIIQPLISRLADVAERRGGFIAKYAGDALLVLFGVPQWAEDDATRAVQVAGEMHAALAGIRDELPDAGRHLQMHVGVGTGTFASADLMAAEQRVILGEAVELAQRLEAAAPSGATYVDDNTRALAMDAAAFEAVPDTAVAGCRRVWRAVNIANDDGASQATTAALEALRSAFDASAAGTDITDERRLVTVVFVDIAVGDAPDPLGVMADVVAGLAPIAERYAGYVAQYAHDALLAFFGAPTAHDDDAVRALLAARDMHRALPDLVGSGSRGSVRVRAGVNSGHVVSGWFGGQARADFSVLGDAVNLAQRLQSNAAYGETLVGAETYELARAHLSFDSVGPLRLKGKPEPVPAWRLVDEHRESSAEPTPSAGRSPFVGRQRELETLVDGLVKLRRGEGGVVAVVGDAGAGKSRLIAEAREAAAARDIRWLEARSISYGSEVAYWSYIELLRRTFAVTFETERDEAVRRLRDGLASDGTPEALPFFARLLDLDVDGDETVARLEPEAFRRTFERIFTEWLMALERRSPVVLAVEDLHWADVPSVSLTNVVARACDRAGVLVLATSRPEGAGVLDELSSRVDAQLLSLRPLDGDATEEIVASVLGGTPPPALLTAVSRRAAGNPFFVEELVRELLDAGAIVRDGERWTMRDGWNGRMLPRTVEGVLSARIDLLPHPVARTLTNASVIGRQVRLPILRGVEPEAPDLEQRLGVLVEGGFLDRVAGDDETLLFHHALVQDVAYSRLLRRRRRQLHQLVADVAEGLYGAGDDVVDLLARHSYLGDGGRKAIDLLLRAGQRSERLFANDEALLHLARAEEIARRESDGRLPSILMRRAALQELVGDYDGALSSYGEARDATDDPRAWRGLASTLRQRSEYEHALALTDEAIGRGLATQDPGLWLERAWILTRMGRYDESDEALVRGLATVAGDGALAGQLLLQRAQNDTLRERVRSTIEHAGRAMTILEASDDLRSLARALRLLADGHWKSGSHEEARRVLERGLEIAQRIGDREEIGALLITLGLVGWDGGDLDRAIAWTLQAREEFDSINHRSGQAISDANVATMLLARGDVDDARVYAERGLASARDIGHQMTVADALKTLAEIDVAQGRSEGAAEHGRLAAALFAELGLRADADECLEVVARVLDGSNTEDPAERDASEEIGEPVRPVPGVDGPDRSPLGGPV